MIAWHELLNGLKTGDRRSLARCISLVENESEGYRDLLTSLTTQPVPVIGITGPPGAGKSTLINAITKVLIAKNKKVGIIAVDPSSPFNLGALLADRLRMSEHYNHPFVFIRSLATRGSLGGISVKTYEAVDVMKAFSFDVIIVETVGVGQAEVEIAGLADTTVLVLVPESGDEAQIMKAGIMEIADIFVVNKGDRKGSGEMVKHIYSMFKAGTIENRITPVFKTIATSGEGIEEITCAIENHQKDFAGMRKTILLTERAFNIIQHNRMRDIDKNELRRMIEDKVNEGNFNLYDFVSKYCLLKC